MPAKALAPDAPELKLSKLLDECRQVRPARMAAATKRKQAEAKLAERARIEADLRREPERVRSFYQVTSYRIEPVGLAYLWSVTG